jgi:DNA-binding transcriptional regulator YbjK
MQLFDFLSDEEIENLPTDDHAAFLQFVKLSRRSLSEQTRNLDDNDEHQWRHIQEARHGFMNVVTAAAKRYQVEPFASLVVPRLKNYGSDEHREFISDLDHYMTQLVLSDAMRSKRDSIVLSENAKSKIRTHLHHLRESVANSDLPEEKRDRLLQKLLAFESEIEKRRLSIFAVGMVTLEVLAIPGAMAGSYDIVNKMLAHVLHTVAEEKTIQDDRQPMYVEPPPVILPARPAEKKDRLVNQGDDSDIPF